MSPQFIFPVFASQSISQTCATSRARSNRFPQDLTKSYLGVHFGAESKEGIHSIHTGTQLEAPASIAILRRLETAARAMERADRLLEQEVRKLLPNRNIEAFFQALVQWKILTADQLAIVQRKLQQPIDETTFAPEQATLKELFSVISVNSRLEKTLENHGGYGVLPLRMRAPEIRLITSEKAPKKVVYVLALAHPIILAAYLMHHGKASPAVIAAYEKLAEKCGHYQTTHAAYHQALQQEGHANPPVTHRPLGSFKELRSIVQERGGSRRPGKPGIGRRSGRQRPLDPSGPKEITK